MVGGRSVGLCSVIVALFVVQLLVVPVTGDAPASKETPLAALPPEAVEPASVGGVAQPDGWVPIQNVSLQVRVPPGRSFYVYYDQSTGMLETMRLPDETAGLPPSAVAAVQRSPRWVRSDLARMLAQLAEVPIDLTAGDDFLAPAFGDMDGDGAMDLVVGSAFPGTLTLFRNVDAALHYSPGNDVYVNGVFVQNASFFPSTVKPLGGYSHPAIGDLNGDNLPDLLIGGGGGRVSWFENNGPASNPTWASKSTIATITTSGFAAPAMGDLDADGDLDLIVGHTGGTLYYARNDGVNPQYVSDGDPATTTIPSWPAVQTLMLGIPSHSSPALADLDDDGTPEMAVGEDAGIVHLFDHNGASWVEVPSAYPGIATDARAVPALADLDDDGLADLVLGGQAGLLRYYPNRGFASGPKHFVWPSYATGYNQINFNQYYSAGNNVFLTEYRATPYVLQYAAIVNSAPQAMVDEVAFSIANANNASLVNPSAFPEVYLNNTEALYFNAQFTSYAQIMDYGLGTEDQWSTVRYLVNESGTPVWEEYPRDIYYWWLVSPKGTDELATFIDPFVMASGHEGAANRSFGGMFWRWAAFHEASATWPGDPGTYKYPKEELPPILREKIGNAAVLWNETTYSFGALYNDNGTFVRDTGGNITRPWNETDQAVEIVAHWVGSTLALNAQEHSDGNRPRQPVRIQWEHNGNCGEISDLLWAGLRSALIPARGICGYGGDHCWGEFYDRGWHQIDDYWSASATIIANNDNYHYGWNRDWSGLMAVRGDGFDVDVVANYHKAWNASYDTAYPPESRGLLDRANVTVVVTDANGNPLDGVKVTVGDYRYLGSWMSFGTQWAFTDAEGKAYLYTSEARQNWAADPNAGDSFDDGIGIYAIGKFGVGELGTTYGSRLKPAYGDAYNARNAPMNYYNFTLLGENPRPGLLLTPVAAPPRDFYALNVSFRVVASAQHPASAVRWNEGLGFHELELTTGTRVTAFLATAGEAAKFRSWRPFEASSVSYNASGADFVAGIPSGEDWYFVLANPGTMETTQIVDLSVQLVAPEPETRSINITSGMLGMRLMSLPLRPIDAQVESVLASVAGCYDVARAFDASDPAEPWKSYMPAKAYNALRTLDETMGFWINFTQPCTFTVTGYPVDGARIPLRKGWNLVGYPSAATTYTVADLIADLGTTGVRVESLDPAASPYYLRVPPPTYALAAWEGYWILVPQDRTWTVAG